MYECVYVYVYIYTLIYIYMYTHTHTHTHTHLKYFLILKLIFFKCNLLQSWIFPLLQSSVSHDPSEIIHVDFGFQLSSIIIENSKEQQFYDIEIFCSIINVFTTLG